MSERIMTALEIAQWARSGEPATLDLERAILRHMEHHMAVEYERGKQHGADDRRMIEQQNRAQSHEIDRLKGELARLKKEAWMNR